MTEQSIPTTPVPPIPETPVDQNNWTGVNPNASTSTPQAELAAVAQPVDYFAFAETHRFMLPDGVQYIEFIKMNEGAKKKFQDTTSSDMVLERRSGDARMSVKQGTQRHELIKACVTGGYMYRQGQYRELNAVQLGDFLTLADPTIVEELERAIRKVNPWLLGEISSSDIEKEIENLTEQLEIARKREAGEAS